MAKSVRTPVGLSPEIPLVIKRELLKLSNIAQTAQASAQQAKTTADSKLGRSKTDLDFVAEQLKSSFQPGGVAPLELTGLLGHAAQPQVAGVPNLTKLPVGGPYAQPTSLVGVNGVLFGYTTGPNTPQLPYSAPVLSGTHAARLATFPAGNYPAGMLFFETDREVFYIVEILVGVATWVYASGEMLCNFGTIALPTDLVTPDKGFIVYEQTLKHHYIWGGSGWSFADEGNTQICAFANTTPTGGVWGLCDGSTYACARADGSGTINVVSPNLTNNVTLQGGAVTGQRAATTPTWTAPAKTDDESAHTHVTNVGSVNINNGAGAALIVGASGGFPTVVTTPHHHTLTSGVADLNPPSEAAGGMPLRITLAWYMRL